MPHALLQEILTHSEIRRQGIEARLLDTQGKAISQGEGHLYIDESRGVFWPSSGVLDDEFVDHAGSIQFPDQKVSVYQLSQYPLAHPPYMEFKIRV